MRGALVPSFRAESRYLLLLVGTVGTTITPYMQLFQQSSVVEKGVSRRRYGPERLDVLVGAVCSTVIAASIVVAAGATLHATGRTEIETAADAARALQPVAGDAAQVLFAVGLLGASSLAAGVLPLATAYAVSEAFGLRKGVDLDFRQAPVFRWLFTGMLVVGAVVTMLPHIPVVPFLVAIQVLNGVLLPMILLFLLPLSNDARLMGHLKDGRLADEDERAPSQYVSQPPVLEVAHQARIVAQQQQEEQDHRQQHTIEHLDRHQEGDDRDVREHRHHRPDHEHAGEEPAGWPGSGSLPVAPPRRRCRRTR
ncbi:MAG TPA: divalent metal cation transporter [Chloroflexota bacterium]|nr:divalent metal cation transporter [Chloroflexota bacterium]